MVMAVLSAAEMGRAGLLVERMAEEVEQMEASEAEAMVVAMAVAMEVNWVAQAEMVMAARVGVLGSRHVHHCIRPHMAPMHCPPTRPS